MDIFFGYIQVLLLGLFGLLSLATCVALFAFGKKGLPAMFFCGLGISLLVWAASILSEIHEEEKLEELEAKEAEVEFSARKQGG